MQWLQGLWQTLQQVHQTCFFFLLDTVLLHFPGMLKVSMAIRPGSRQWNMNRNDLSNLQAWSMKLPNGDTLCSFSQVNDLGTHILRMKELQNKRSMGSLIITWSRTNHLNFKWVRSIFPILLSYWHFRVYVLQPLALSIKGLSLWSSAYPKTGGPH